MCQLLSNYLPPRQQVGMAQLAKDLRARRRLQENELYPREVQVDCPLPDCLGIGYLGFDNVMCFICGAPVDHGLVRRDARRTQALPPVQGTHREERRLRPYDLPLWAPFLVDDADVLLALITMRQARSGNCE